MALANNTDLRSEIQTLAFKTYSSGELDNIIARAESVLLRKLVRARELLTTTTMTVDAASESLPSDCFLITRAKFSDRPTLKYLVPDDFHNRYLSNDTGDYPLAYTVEGGTIFFGPAPSSSLTMNYSYVKKLDITTDTTNRLLTLQPDIYLFACLAAAGEYNGDDGMEAKYLAKLEKAIDEMDEAQQYMGTIEYASDVP